MAALVDKNGNTIRYGRINTRMVGAWARGEVADDGPFWALNLMKYRDIADYAGASGEAAEQDGAVSGREADDAYTPRDSLAAIGAMIAFAADVDQTIAGDGVRWDRIGIVRYPSRKAFLAMQQRDDFKAKHIHKDAGMEFTIVMSCLPKLPFGGSTERTPLLEMSVSARQPEASEDGGVFEVEGVIVGDERTWATASFRWLAQAPPEAPRIDTRDEYRLIVRPTIDRLTRSVLEA